MTAIADEGVSLLTIVGESGRKRLDELSVARVIAEVAETLDLENAASQPIQPTRILILRTGAVRLDGKPAGADEEIAYTAPERLRGESGDHRSDVFSLGVVMWEALTHARLFEGLTEDAIKEAVLADEVSAPSTRNANIPGELDVICLRALSRDPASRYPTAKAMAVEIEGVLRDASYGRANDAIGAFVSTLPKELFRKVVPAKASLPAPKAAPKIGTHTMIGLPQPKPPAETVPMPGLNQSVPTVPLNPLSDTAPGLGSPVLKPPAEVAKVVESVKGVPALDAPPPAKSTDTVMGIGRLVEVIPDDPIQPAVDGPAVVLLPKPPILPTSLLVPKKAEGPHVVPAHIAEAPTQMVAPVSAVEASDKPARASSPNEFEDEPSASPVEVPASTDKGTGGRDVLAGWAWQTGGQESINDDDDIAVPPPSRRPLFIAIGGALAVLGIIAIVAFAGGGSKPDDDKQAVAKPQVATVDPTPPAPTPPPDPNAVKPDPGSAASDPTAPAGSATDPAGSATTNPTDTTNPSATATPPTTTGTTTDPPATGSATNGAATNPPAVAATTGTNPPAVTTTTTPPAGTTTPPSGTTKTTAAKTDATTKADPKTSKTPEPPKKVDPPKVAKADPPKKIEAPKKKIEPKPPRVATAPKARPVDPYPDAKPDAETSYRNGVQAFARGDTSAALISLRSALDANPRFAPTSRALGLVYEKLGERNQAVRAYRRYLQLAPGAGDADQIRGRLERLGS